jgi:hypothetical protein
MMSDPSGMRPSARACEAYIDRYGWDAFNQEMSRRYGGGYFETWPEAVRLRLGLKRDYNISGLGYMGTNSKNRLNRIRWMDEYVRRGTINPGLADSMARHGFTTPDAYFKDVYKRTIEHEEQKFDFRKGISALVASVVTLGVGVVGTLAGHPEIWEAAPLIWGAVYSGMNAIQGVKDYQVFVGGSFGPGSAPSYGPSSDVEFGYMNSGRRSSLPPAVDTLPAWSQATMSEMPGFSMLSPEVQQALGGWTPAQFSIWSIVMDFGLGLGAGELVPSSGVFYCAPPIVWRTAPSFAPEIAEATRAFNRLVTTWAGFAGYASFGGRIMAEWLFYDWFLNAPVYGPVSRALEHPPNEHMIPLLEK